MGVTGTLKTSKPELKIIENVYNIKINTIMPSLFGLKVLRFESEIDVFVENKYGYFGRLK